MAESEESSYMLKLSQDIIHIVIEQQQEFTSELDKHIYYTGLEMYYNRRDEEKRIDDKLEAVARKWEMWGRAEPQPEPEPEPELEPLTELINVEQILNELLMMEKEAGFVGLGREELCS